MERRNATAAVIGAGDYIGAAIAKKFAAEGFTVFAGRRNGEKQGEQDELVEVNPERATPQLAPDCGLVLHEFAVIDEAGEHGGEADEPLGGRNESDGLIGPVAQDGGQVRHHHQDEKKTSQRVKFRAALRFGSSHALRVRRLGRGVELAGGPEECDAG